MGLLVRTIGLYKILDIDQPAKKYEDVVNIKEKINELIEDGERLIAIDLSNVDYMHSFFIKIITSAYKKLKNMGGNVCLIGPNDFIRNLISLLNINEYISVFKSEDNFREFLENP